MSGIKGMNRKSKFDPYIEEIKVFADMGYSIRKIAEELDQCSGDIVDESALYAFMRNRNIKSKHFQGGKNRGYQPPVCAECEGCFEVIGLNDKPVRICYGARLIGNGVITSPPWCHKRERQVG